MAARLTLATVSALSVVGVEFHNGWKRIFVCGGGGFIGSHLVSCVLKEEGTERLVVFDNFSSGRRAYLADTVSDPRLRVVESDLKDLGAITSAMAGCE